MGLYFFYVHKLKYKIYPVLCGKYIYLVINDIPYIKHALHSYFTTIRQLWFTWNHVYGSTSSQIVTKNTMLANYQRNINTQFMSEFFYKPRSNSQWQYHQPFVYSPFIMHVCMSNSTPSDSLSVLCQKQIVFL